MTTLLLLLLPAAWAAGFPHSREVPPPADPQVAGAPACADLDLQSWLSRQPREPRPGRAGPYHMAWEVFAGLEALRRDWPGKVRVACVGRTVQGRPIWAFTVRDPTTPATREVLVFAQLHALEWVGAEVCLELARALVHQAPRGVAVTIVPIVNLDGRLLSEADMREGRTDAYRRANAAGTDLNRDFAVNRTSTNAWSRLPFFRRYYTSSEAALSQPETRALDDLAREVGGHDAVISLHAFGGFIFYPWAGLYAPPPAAAELRAVGAHMAAAMPNRPYKVKQLSHNAVWFRGLGMEIDHFHATWGSDAWLIELTRSGIRLGQPSTWKDYWRWYNPPDPSPDIEDGTAAVLAAIRHTATSPP